MAEEINAEEDESAFPQDEIDRFVQEIAEDVLKDAMWDELMVPHWVNRICEEIMGKLNTELKRPYKYIVSCLMQQKTNTVSCHSAFSTYWENGADGVATFIYPPAARKESANKTVTCLVMVYATRF